MLSLTACFRLLYTLLMGLLLGCASTPPKEEHTIGSVFLQNLHYRRPLVVGAVPDAAPEEPGFQRSPLPDAQFDCEPYPRLFEQVPVAQVRSCLKEVNEINPPVNLRYRVKRQIVPVLELEDPEEAPACVQDTLKTLPVPREIFFQSVSEGHLACYSSSLFSDSDSEGPLVSLKKWLRRFRLDIHFPLASLPRNDEETQMLLQTWTIGPFWNLDRTAIVGRVVPETICKKCMGKAYISTTLDGLPPDYR